MVRRVLGKPGGWRKRATAGIIAATDTVRARIGMATNLEGNKIVAAVLTAGITFAVAGVIGRQLVHATMPHHTAMTVPGEAVAPTAPAAAPVLDPISPLLASADAAAGQQIAQRQCASCHSFTAGGRAGVGPNLYGIVGAKHAHADGFNYSQAIRGMADKPWTYEELNAWVHSPRTYAPGNRMSYAGLANTQQRANLIAYLRSISPNAPAP